MTSPLTTSYKRFAATDIFMLVAVLIWAVNFSIVKLSLYEFTPLGFNGIRLSLAALVLAGVLAASGEGFSVRRADRPKILLLGLLGNTIYQLLFIHGIARTSASNTSIIIAMTPGFIALLSVLFKHERVHPAAWAGIGISFIGFYFVVTHRSGAVSFSWETFQGDGLVFIGALSWTFYTVLSKPLLERYSPLKLTALTMGAGTLFFIPFCVPDLVHLSYAAVPGKAWFYLVFSGLFAIVICYIIWYASVRRVGNSKTAIYDNLIPVFTVLFAHFILGERVTLLQAAGACVIFFGVYLTRSGYRMFIKS
jgi:drug/metabolite transporter (DMT)-like permease